MSEMESRGREYLSYTQKPKDLNSSRDIADNGKDPFRPRPCGGTDNYGHERYAQQL